MTAPTDSTLRRRLDKAGWTNTGNGGVAWFTVVARRTISVQVERFATNAWRAWTLVVDGRGSFDRVVVGEAHAPTFELAVGEAKRMRERIESQIEAMLLDLSTKADVEAPKDHVINLTGLRDVGPWVGEGLTAALQKADKLRDAYREYGLAALDLAEAYRKQYPDAKAFRVRPRKTKAASK